MDATTTPAPPVAIITTSLIETSVYGTKAYHVKCSCGYETKRFDRETTAARKMGEHADAHRAEMEAADNQEVPA